MDGGPRSGEKAGCEVPVDASSKLEESCAELGPAWDFVNLTQARVHMGKVASIENPPTPKPVGHLLV